jgi:hypothetical protein
VSLSGVLFILLGLTQGVGLPFNLYTIIGAYIVIVSIFAFLNRYQAMVNVEIQQEFIRFLQKGHGI